jgi:hypothetical protein
MLAPYLDALVERLLALLRSPPAGGAHYVQEQAVTTLAVVADASEATFVKASRSFMEADRRLTNHNSIIRASCHFFWTPSRMRMVSSIGNFGRSRWSVRGLSVCIAALGT